jgi:hypothetical protein
VGPATHVQRSACRCGPPPEWCMAEEQALVQLGWARKPFRNQPRMDREVGLSVLRGPISVMAAVRYVLPQEPTDGQLKNGRIRLTTAGSLREAGFAVVHTPGPVRRDEHCTVVWPDSEPLSSPQVPWPPEVSARFDSCFNEEEEVRTDES